MWNLIGAINSLRNQLSHSLDPGSRSKKLESLAVTYAQEFPELLPEKIEGMSRDSAICVMAISGCLGFLHTFAEEIKRLKSLVLTLDKAMNKGKLV
jgi:hypothetical protein